MSRSPKRAAKSPTQQYRDDGALAWMARDRVHGTRSSICAHWGFRGLAALGSGRPVGTRGMLEVLAQPMGDLLIWMIAGGLICFAGWRLVEAIFDPDIITAVTWAGWFGARGWSAAAFSISSSVASP